MADRVVNQVVLLPTAAIEANPVQPRQSFSEDGLRSLASSIEESGLLQPITVRQVSPGHYVLIAGERRLRACRMLGHYEIAAIVEETDAFSGGLMSLIENLQRADLDFFEQSTAIDALLRMSSLSQAELARRIGMAQSTLANKLRLLRLPAPVRDRILEAGLTERHARCLLQLEGEKKLMEAVQYISAHQMNVAQTERYVSTLLEEQRPKQTRLFILKDVRIFINTINRAVETMKLAGIDATTQREDNDDYISFTVHIPKKSAVRRNAERSPEAG